MVAACFGINENCGGGAASDCLNYNTGITGLGRVGIICLELVSMALISNLLAALKMSRCLLVGEAFAASGDGNIFSLIKLFGVSIGVCTSIEIISGRGFG